MENLLSEAFQKLSLLEQDFDFSTVDKDKVDKLSEFISDDVDFIPEEPIIDVNAEDEEDLADNYIGKVILECECCHSRIYKDEADVVIDDESGVANIEEACPVCNNELGYSVIGKIEAFNSDRDIKPEEDDEEIPEDDFDEPEEEIEDEEEKDESLKNSKVASDDSKKLDEAHLPLKDRIARKHLNSLLDVEEELSAEEAARMAEITKDGIVHACDRDEYNDLRKKDKDESLANSDVASEDSKKLDEADDVCPECGKNPCTCEACEKEELDERMYDSQFDKDFDDAVDELERQEKENKVEEELPADDLPDPWGEKVDESDGDFTNDYVGRNAALNLQSKHASDYDMTDEEFAELKAHDAETGKIIACDCFANPYAKGNDKFKDQYWTVKFDDGFEVEAMSGYEFVLDESCNESLTEAVELHTDGEPVDLVKNEDGSLSIEVGGDEVGEMPIEEPIAEPVEAGAEEIVPLDAEDKAAIEANEPEAEEGEELFSKPVEDEFSAEDEFAEEPEEENEEEFESLESSNKPAINESAKETNTIQDKIAKETLKQAKIETKMMQLDLAAKQAEAEATAPVEEPIEDEVPEEVEESLDSDLFEDITDLDETKFNHMCETYLRRVYENVDTFETSKILTDTNRVVVEGIINFNSGKSKATVFDLSNATKTPRGKIVVEGFNKTFTDADKAFTVKFGVNENTLVAESMIYNYSIKQLNESDKQEVVRIRGRVKA